MSFCVYNADVALCNNERVVLCNVNDNTENTIQLPELKLDKKIDVHNNVDIESYHTITNVSFSDDGKYLFVCTNRKQLCLYERKSLKLLSNRTLARAASRVRFAPNNDIVVADKAGDAYVFSTKNPEESGVLILGHMSMLLDVLITANERYVVTTDRDEKIRVSMYPNSYNIVSYCLGHTKFVTNICELPHDEKILVSSGGDGTLKLWKYEEGREMLSVEFGERISKDDLEKFNQDLQEYHLDESVEVLPVKHLRLSRLDETSSLAVVSFYNSRTVLIYVISGTVKTKLEARYLQSLEPENETLECLVQYPNLWILNDLGLEIYEFKDNVFVPSKTLNSKLTSLNTSWKSLNNTTCRQNLFPILYKRKYDNVQEYLERKKMRLANVLE